MAELEGDVEHHNPRFNEKMWRVEVVTWFAMAAILLAAILGLFGHGLLSDRTAGDPSGPIWVEYDRFTRRGAESEWIVHLNRDAIREGKASVWLDKSFMPRLALDRVVPTPESTTLRGDGTVYVFAAAPGANDVVVTFYVKPASSGPHRGGIGLADGAARLNLNQFAYP